MEIQSGSKVTQLKTRYWIWFLASAIFVNFIICQISVGQAELVSTTVVVGVGVGVGIGAKPEFLIRAVTNNKSASAEELKLFPRAGNCNINHCDDIYDYCNVTTGYCEFCYSNYEWDGQKCVYCSYPDRWNGTACVSCSYPDRWDYDDKICKNVTDNSWMIWTFIPLGVVLFMLLVTLPACCLRNKKCPMYRERQGQDFVVTSVHTISTVPSGGAPGSVPEPAGVIIGQSRYGHDAFGNPVMLASRHIVMDAPAPVDHPDPRQLAGRDLPPPYYPTAPTNNNRY